MRAFLIFLAVSVVYLQNFEANATSEPSRGLKVVAKDNATQQLAEVPLYTKSFAVIIGIDDYKNLPPDRQLKLAVRDAKGVEATLKKHYKFDKIVTLFNRDATRSRILDVLTDELPREMSDNDALFVFFAGHGDQIKRGKDEIGYLIPHDGQVEKLSTVISMADLRDTVSKAIPAKHVFYVIDACYGGLMTATRAVDKAPRRDLNYLKEITKEPVRQVLTAGGKGEEVLDGGPNGHSVFTGRLIEVLERTGDFVTANEIQAILKEKVFGDARARNHTQTPAYGTLYGSGDFVFIPGLEQKVADNQGEIAKLQAELAALDAADAVAKTAASTALQLRQQREADSARKAAEGKLKAEQLKQQQLAEEDKRRQAEEIERQRLLAAKGEDEKKLAELKVTAEARRKSGGPQSVGEFPTVESAIAEIKRLNARIDSIETAYAKQLAQTRQQVSQRYASQLAALSREQKDEFESSSAFKARQEKQRSDIYRQRDEELGQLNAKKLAAGETTSLREQIVALSNKEYVVSSDRLTFELGAYDADEQRFSVTIKNKSGKGALPIQVASTGTIPLVTADARSFKQQYTAGLVRPEARVRAGGEVMEVAVINDADQSSRSEMDGEFIAISANEREARRQEKEQERQWIVYRPEMIWIPAGSFQMGGRASDSKPIHPVSIAAFHMARTEVTQAQWRVVMEDNPSSLKNCDECPVENVSWDDIQKYLGKLNAKTGKQYRLPSEAEWEYACRAGGTHDYCGSNNLDSVRGPIKTVAEKRTLWVRNRRTRLGSTI